MSTWSEYLYTTFRNTPGVPSMHLSAATKVQLFRQNLVTMTAACIMLRSHWSVSHRVTRGLDSGPDPGPVWAVVTSDSVLNLHVQTETSSRLCGSVWCQNPVRPTLVHVSLTRPGRSTRILYLSKSTNTSLYKYSVPSKSPAVGMLLKVCECNQEIDLWLFYYDI